MKCPVETVDHSRCPKQFACCADPAAMIPGHSDIAKHSVCDNDPVPGKEYCQEHQMFEKFLTHAEEAFVAYFRDQQTKNFEISRNHGFEDDDKYNFGEKIALMHSELSEALESYRHGDQLSDHIPEFTGIEEEYADVIIRIQNDAERHGFRVAEAMVAKQKFNQSRPYKHGGKRF